MALALILSTGTIQAGPWNSAPEAWLASAALGQSSAAAPNASGDPRREVDDLLQRARQAMGENDFATADSLIAKAEALGVSYNALYMGDTPKKARRDLERKRAAAAQGSSNPLLASLGLNRDKQAPTKDPFTLRAADGNRPDARAPEEKSAAPLSNLDSQQVTPLPRVDSAAPLRAPAVANHANNNPNPVGNANVSPLRAARVALAYGDVRRATELVGQARASGAVFPPSGDPPDKVEAAIRKHQETLAVDKNTEAYARLTARNLMEQADGLLRWGEWDEAERLASRAAGLRITYGPMDPKPQDMLQRIAAARRESAAGAAPAGSAVAASDPTASLATRQTAGQLVRQARQAMAAGQFEQAEALARQAQQMRLPANAFAPGEDRPELVLLDLQQLKQRIPASGVVPAGGQYVVPAGGNGGPSRAATGLVYNPASDPTRNVLAAGQAPAPDAAAPRQGMILFQQGEAALRAHDANRAYDLFRQAMNHPDDLDPLTMQRLQDHLQLLAAPRARNPQPAEVVPTPAGSMADQAAAQRQLLVRQVVAELGNRESAARAMRPTDPKGALTMLEDARRMVEAAGLDDDTRGQLLRRVDRSIGETKQFIEQNRPQIELAEKNQSTEQEVARQQKVKVEVQEKIAMKIDLYNRLMAEQRYEEAGITIKEARELAPNDPVVNQALVGWRLIKNYQDALAIRDAKADGFVAALNNAEKSAIPFDDTKPYQFGVDAKQWSDMSKLRQKFSGQAKRARSEREIEIEKKLRTPVSMQFTNAPLSKVLDYLAKLAEVNLHLDPKGLSEEGVTTDTPVTINLTNEIMLKSALHLILDPLHLSYVIKDEVLNVTSEQARDGQVYNVVYNVADLVIPIPNFVPTSMGLQSAYDRAMNGVGFSGGLPFGSSTSTPLSVVSTGSGKGGALNNDAMLAQQMSGGGARSPLGAGAAPAGTSPAAGPGGLGGGAQADFDTLIDIITGTVKPESWEDVGGPGTIRENPMNLSLIIGQTQEVHEEIVDLLEQLRRLQDLQVTIEVRFITLNDNFFERIGVSFDFEINDNIDGKNVLFGGRTQANGIGTVDTDFVIGKGVARNVYDQDANRTVTVGLASPTMFSADLDIPFTQDSFSLAVPQFGGYDATAGASLGFAILSDLEAYFFIEAAQGDKRSNVLQAPKVTLFNGQQAFVSDTSQSPFVISVVPVVGDFSAALQPVIVVLSEGTFMTVQAVVSNDRRFVRLTVVPFFSQIGEVNTFTFTGSTTTTVDSTREGLRPAAKKANKLWTNKEDNVSVERTGTTVQLPTFSYVTVTTTVSVPDGGTVLLGGIKRLSEGRNEFGVPLLNKLPYINRLFKNVGIGRETQSLMMMVTPRIIIQEEEEEKLGVSSE